MADHHHLRPPLPPASVPLTRARSAQHAPPPPLVQSSSHYMYYEDYYWDDHLYSPNSSAVGSASGGASSRNPKTDSSQPPGPAIHRSPSEGTLPSSTSSTAFSPTHSNTGTAAAATMLLFPEPHIPNFHRDRSPGTGARGTLNSYSDSYLRIPPQHPQRSPRIEGRGEITHPFNQSETSLDRTADLLDLLSVGSGADEGARTLTRPRSLALSEHEEQELLQNGIAKFQEGSLPEADTEWHRLVSEDFRNSLPKNEIQRQSTIFEVIKSERDYVRDLSLVEELFIKALMEADPPVIKPETRLRAFRNDVFQNITDILARHHISLAALFERQREQHPLVSSVADIELDSALAVRDDYEAYIKQYPIAESRHRRELRSNPAYNALIEKALKDPRLLRRGLIDLISRPVTRLPRISLILEHVYKLTDPEHPDIETMPLTLTILSDFVKSTEPGVAVAEARVKFAALCESLVYRPGEIIDMDLNDPQRHLVYSGTVGRKYGSEWRDVMLSLLDNVVVITSPEVRLGRTYNILISRPIPLECLGLGGFKDEPVSRREENGTGRLLSITKPSHPVFPFTIFHRLDAKRRYTVYVERENIRTRWHEILVDTLAVRQTEREVNKWYVPEVVDSVTFVSRTPGVLADSAAHLTGRIAAVTTFVELGKTYVVVATGDGLYAAALVSRPQFRRFLSTPTIQSLTALSNIHQLFVLQDGALLSYNLPVLVSVIQGKSTIESFAGSMRRVSPKDHTVYLFSAGIMSDRSIVVYATKGFRSTTMQALEAVSQAPAPDQSRNGDPVTTFRPYGNQFYVPREVTGVVLLQRTLAISTQNGIAVVEPTQVGTDIVLVPDWTAGSDSQARAMLKERCDASRPLGLARSGADELIVIYEEFGCYITKYGEPTRNHGFVRWETPMQSFVVREPHLIIVGSDSIEVRHTPTGRLLQVIEGKEIRLMQALPIEQGPVLLTRRGKKDDWKGTLSDELVELVPTAPLGSSDDGFVWEEWNT